MLDDMNFQALASDAKFYESYSRKKDDGTYETWHEAVSRVMDMHRTYYADKMSTELEALISFSEALYADKAVLGAQRALQFGGNQLLKHHMKMYNCTSSYADRVEFFGELFYILLCGAGAGFSVQKHHVENLPHITARTKQAKTHQIGDSIEGWATALDVLLSSLFVGGGKHPEYEGRRVCFDYSLIREKGALISGGFLAPGPEPLRKALGQIEDLIVARIKEGYTQLRPIDVYDICMYASDAVISGGVRRSATICLFSIDDEEMLNAKTGNWFQENRQRARSNNSAMVIRNEVTREQFARVMKSVKEFGEPGFVFSESREHTYNPCVEIGKYPVWIDENGDKHSGFQGCNLTEINGSYCKTKEAFFDACRAAAIMGTLQAGYTNFTFLSDVSKKIFDREALLGVSITGWMNNPHVLFDEETLKQGAEIVKKVNAEVAKMIRINPAARTTCVKPSGNASVILMTASGIHGDHAPRYLRNMQLNKMNSVAHAIFEANSHMVEESVWSANGTDYMVSFPVISPEGSIFKKDLYGTNLLDYVKFVQKHWVETGKNHELCVDDRVRHNVSNTVQVADDQWDEVEQYLFDNRNHFAGVSLLSAAGDKDFQQAPFTEVLTQDEVIAKYGDAALYVMGLVRDANRAYDNIWAAVSAVKFGTHNPTRDQKHWAEDFKAFADEYFDGDLTMAEHCAKDVVLLQRWKRIQRNYVPMDFTKNMYKTDTDINTLGAIACSGGSCEIV